MTLLQPISTPLLSDHYARDAIISSPDFICFLILQRFWLWLPLLVLLILFVLLFYKDCSCDICFVCTQIVNLLLNKLTYLLNLLFTKVVVVAAIISINDFICFAIISSNDLFCIVLFYKDCGCEHECVDEDSGGHHCECRLGFALDQDGTSCYGKSIIRCILMILYSVLNCFFLDFRYYLKSILPCWMCSYKLVISHYFSHWKVYYLFLKVHENKIITQ